MPLQPVFGSMDSLVGRNDRAITQEFNLAPRQLVAGPKGNLLLDVAALANCIGLNLTTRRYAEAEIEGKERQ